MASLFEPVGPEGRGVYWRRRAVLLVVVLLVLLLVAKACSGGSGSSPSPSASSHPASTPHASSSPHASSTPSGSHRPTSSAGPSSSPSSSVVPVAACKDSDVLVTATPAKTNYAVGDTVTITYVVGTKGGARCQRDVGAAADEVRVVTGSRIIWSTDYCNPGGKKDVRTIGPKDSFSVIVAWNGDVTAPGCPATKLPAPAGDYEVLGRNGAVFGPSAPLVLG